MVSLTDDERAWIQDQEAQVTPAELARCQRLGILPAAMYLEDMYLTIKDILTTPDEEVWGGKTCGVV